MRDRPSAWSILARGPRYIIRVATVLALLRISERVGSVVDLLLGVDTGGFASAEDLKLSPTGHGFAPSPWSTLRRVLHPREVSAADVFLDIGAGKGRILLAAAISYGFGQVRGLEVSPDLVAIARRNFDDVRIPIKCGIVSIMLGDMVDVTLPDDVTVVYAYDPFEGDLFNALVRELIASVDRRPRTLRFIYLAPYQERQLLDTGRVQLVRRVRWGARRLDPRWGGVALYEVR